MQVKLLAFASSAADLGWREHSCECDESETPRAIFTRVAPGFDPGKARVAVDCEYAEWDEPVGPATTEIAIIPPVSGG